MRRIAASREKELGRVLVGPKMLGKGYARIVAQGDGSGRIESFNPATRKWFAAPDSVSFADVWTAPAVPNDLLQGIMESE